jgi:SAM-dependent methyltransferase
VEADLEQAVMERFVTAARSHATEPDRTRPVGDLGCGTGRLGAHLADAGLSVVGLDLSIAMLRHARADHPALPVAVGRIDRLPVATASLGAAVAWYSIIYTPSADLPALAAEFARVLQPGAPLLLGFQCSGDAMHYPDAFGSGVALTSQRHRPDLVASVLLDAGFQVDSVDTRPPAGPFEHCDQAVVLARRVPGRVPGRTGEAPASQPRPA